MEKKWWFALAKDEGGPPFYAIGEGDKELGYTPSRDVALKVTAALNRMENNQPRLFYWRSEAAKNYGNGHVIAMAVNEHEARNAAMAAFDRFCTDRWSWLDQEDTSDRQQLLDLVAQFRKDISAEPKILDKAIVIEGSE